MSGIHELAYVAPTAEIGEGCTIGPFAVVGPGVVLGPNNEIRSHAVLDGPGTTLGEGNVVYAGAVIGGPPQDKKYHGESTTLVIGDRNDFRETTTANRGTSTGGGETRIGSDNLFLAGCHVAHDCQVGSHAVLSNDVLLAGHVEVQDYAIMNGACAIHHFGTVGTLSYIGGLTRLVRDAPPYCVTEGHPARVVKVNTVGLERRGVPANRIRLLQRAFRHIFRNRHATMQLAFEALDDDGYHSPELRTLRNFLEAMRRGKNGRQRQVKNGD